MAYPKRCFDAVLGSRRSNAKLFSVPPRPTGTATQKLYVPFPADAAARTVNAEDLGLGPSFRLRRISVVQDGSAVQRVAATTTHNLPHLLVALKMDKNTALLETAAAAALAKLGESLGSKNNCYGLPRDSTRRAATACRAFFAFVSLLQKKRKSNNNDTEGLGIGEEDVPHSSVAAPEREGGGAGLGAPGGRATVLRDVVYAMETRWSERPGGRPPLMGCSRSGKGTLFSA